MFHLDEKQLYLSFWRVVTYAGIHYTQGMKSLVSGIQPSGVPTIGHILGTVKNWRHYQESYRCHFFIADLHAITVQQDPAVLRANSLKLLAFFLASGVDPKKSSVTIQSHVPQHAELSWLLSCFTHLGELSRMTQFKDKSASHSTKAEPFGLFAYPVLMAADILLHEADFVPVGADQKQHIELTRDLVIRFNHRYGEVLKMPEPIIPEFGARVRSLQDPAKKMSKSDSNAQGYISIDDAPEVIVKKIKKAVTDSVGVVAYDNERPGISSLVEMYSVLTDQSVDAVEVAYQGVGYGKFKKDLADVLVGIIEPIQIEMKRLLGDEDYLDSLMREQSRLVISRTAPYLRKIKDAIGLL